MSGWFGLVVAMGIAGCASPRPVPRFAGGVEVPLTVTARGTLLVPVTFGEGATVLPFVLDTAASITALTPHAADTLGVQMSDRTVTVYDSRGYNPEASIATVPELSVGAVCHHKQRVAVVHLRAGDDVDVRYAGVLGLDVLRAHDVVIDFSRNLLGIHHSGDLAVAAATTDMVKTGFHRGRDNLLQLEVSIDGHPGVAAILDLGSQVTVLNSAAAALLGPGPLIDTEQAATGMTLTGKFGQDLRRVRELMVGELPLRHRLVVVADLPVFQRFGLADRPAIILGADLFAGRAVAIAFADRAIFLSR